MESTNPYAVPQDRFVSDIFRLRGADGPWRSGKLLVVGHKAELPNRCVKCNAQIERERKRYNLTWHSRLAFLGLLLGLIPYVLIALATQRKLTAHVGVCDEHRRKRRNAVLLGLLGMVVGLVIIVIGAMLRRQPTATFWLIVGGVVFSFVALCYASFASRVIWPRKIDRKLAWIEGAGEEYLAALPDMP